MGFIQLSQRNNFFIQANKVITLINKSITRKIHTKKYNLPTENNFKFQSESDFFKTPEGTSENKL